MHKLDVWQPSSWCLKRSGCPCAANPISVLLLFQHTEPNHSLRNISANWIRFWLHSHQDDSLDAIFMQLSLLSPATFIRWLDPIQINHFNTCLCSLTSRIYCSQKHIEYTLSMALYMDLKFNQWSIHMLVVCNQNPN